MLIFMYLIRTPLVSAEQFNENSSYLQGSCAVEKFAIDHEAVVKYDTGFAKLDQFTLCMWVRFTKHDGDHVLFTYSGEL